MANESLSAVLQEWAKVFTRNSMREFKRTMDDTGLSPSQLGTLMRLHHAGACGVSTISDHLGISRAATSQMIDRLVQSGLLERAENPADRRAKLLTITPAGEAIIRRSIDARRRWMEKLTDVLDDAQEQIIITALKALTEAAQKLEEKESR